LIDLCLLPTLAVFQLYLVSFVKLVKLYIGPDKLSSVMRDSLAKDSISPILTEPFLFALDRRVIKVLKEIFTCLQDGKNIDDIIIDR
jgi:hypothetical protein